MAVSEGGRRGRGFIVAGCGAAARSGGCRGIPGVARGILPMISPDHREAVMARAASRDVVVLGPRRKARLEAIVRRPSAPQALARRARIAPLAGAGSANARVAADPGLTAAHVRGLRPPVPPR